MPLLNTNIIRAIIGLGNPGKKYEGTRHNIGFKIVDEFLTLKGEIISFDKYGGVYSAKNIAGRKIHFLKPMTYMNLSGTAVKRLTDSENIEPSEILVVQDDMDFELGCVKLKLGGGSAGHNGIESIMSSLQTSDFARLRVGIGRAEETSTIDHVLDKFKDTELEELKKSVSLSFEAIKLTIARDIFMAMNIVNANKPNNNN